MFINFELKLTKERRERSNWGSVYNKYRRINVYITNLRSIDIVFLEINEEAHLFNYLHYEAQNLLNGTLALNFLGTWSFGARCLGTQSQHLYHD